MPYYPPPPAPGVTDHSLLSNLTVGDHHTQYQQESEKNAASGYAGLDASSKLTGSQQVYGALANTAAQGNDGRLSDSRTPTAHVLDGALHTVSGLTAGHALRATGATTYAFGAIADGDLPATIARDSEYQAADTSHAGAADPHAGYLLESLLDLKGDLIVASAADTPARLAVGANGLGLVADSAEATGIKWGTLTAAQPEVPLTALAPASNQTITANYGAYAPEEYEIVNTFALDVLGVFEIG